MMEATAISKWEEAQALELKHWTDSQANGNVDNQLSKENCAAGYKRVSGLIMQRFGFKQDEFKKGTIVDIGAGPTGRTSWLDASIKIAIDPLYEDYQSLPWAQLECYDAWECNPAEKPLHMENFADAVFCINCLDHVYDPLAVLGNAAAYAKDNALVFLSVDIGEQGDEMHPSAKMMEPQAITSMLTQADLMVKKFEIGRAYPTPAGKWLDGWGGEVAGHWWCQRMPRG